jgi:hypothetical protein
MPISIKYYPSDFMELSNDHIANCKWFIHTKAPSKARLRPPYVRIVVAYNPIK